MKTFELGTLYDLPTLEVRDNSHVPYTKVYSQGATLRASFQVNPADNARWLQIYFYETSKDRTRVVGLSLKGEMLEALRDLIAKIPTPIKDN